MAVRFLQEDSALTCLVVLFCYYYGGSGDGGDGGDDGDCAVLTNFYGGWLNEELKIVLADRDQQDGIDWLVNYVFP